MKSKSMNFPSIGVLRTSRSMLAYRRQGKEYKNEKAGKFPANFLITTSLLILNY